MCLAPSLVGPSTMKPAPPFACWAMPPSCWHIPQVRELEAMGYLVATNLLNASDFGVAQRRSRWYIIAARPASSMSSMSAADFRSKVSETLTACRMPHSPLEATLLPPDSPCVAAWLSLFRSGRGSSKRGTACQWEELHKNHFQSCGLPWPAKLDPSNQQRLLDVAKQNSLTEREMSVLTFLLLTGCEASVVDLSQSINRIPMAFGMTPTVMPAGLLFSLNQMRCLTPPEAFALQGLPVTNSMADPSMRFLSSVSFMSLDTHRSRRLRQPHAGTKRGRGGQWIVDVAHDAPSDSDGALDNQRWAFLMELAGNAFCGHCVAASLMATLCWAEAQTEARSPAQLEEPES